MPSRRQLLYGLAVLTPLLSASLTRSGRLSVTSVPSDEAFYMIRDIDTILSLGEALGKQLKDHAETRESEVISEESLPALARRLYSRDMQERVREDCRFGRMIQCKGFILSVEEARLYRAITQALQA